MDESPSIESACLTKGDVEDFVAHEAELLDSWQLDAWLALLTEDVEYIVTLGGVDPHQTPDGSFLVLDDAVRLHARAKQLLGRFVWAERPRSRTRRLVTNIRVSRAPTGSRVTSNFAVYRVAGGETTTYVGRYEYLLVGGANGPRIRKRYASLDADVLKPYGALSIIL